MLPDKSTAAVEAYGNATHCNLSCPGKASETCGGWLSFNLHQILPLTWTDATLCLAWDFNRQKYAAFVRVGFLPLWHWWQRYDTWMGTPLIANESETYKAHCERSTHEGGNGISKALGAEMCWWQKEQPGRERKQVLWTEVCCCLHNFQ